METLNTMVQRHLPNASRLMPWDLAERLKQEPDLLIADVREPAEFSAVHIPGSVNVPRGVLELACDYGYAETVPRLVQSREQPVVLICRSGDRSVLAAHIMSLMGFRAPVVLMTGLRGWNDYEQPLVNADGNPVDGDFAQRFLSPSITPEQLGCSV